MARKVLAENYCKRALSLDKQLAKQYRSNRRFKIKEILYFIRLTANQPVIYLLHKGESPPIPTSPLNFLSISLTKMSNSSNSNDGSESNDEGSFANEEDFKNDLFDRISQVHSTGSFATFGIMDSFVHPGISVDPIGTVRMPLSEEDAQSLILASHKAPFGKGIETVIDESVRKTWQIDAGRVQCLNPRWQSCLDQTVKRVAGELGVVDAATNVRAELYKMLLYEKGALFKAHQEYDGRENNKRVPVDEQ